MERHAYIDEKTHTSTNENKRTYRRKKENAYDRKNTCRRKKKTCRTMKIRNAHTAEDNRQTGVETQTRKRAFIIQTKHMQEKNACIRKEHTCMHPNKKTHKQLYMRKTAHIHVKQHAECRHTKHEITYEKTKHPHAYEGKRVCKRKEYVHIHNKMHMGVKRNREYGQKKHTSRRKNMII